MVASQVMLAQVYLDDVCSSEWNLCTSFPAEKKN